jgi:anti-sigma factor RsiW
MTQHEEWTDKLSDFLDDELTPQERHAVESHLQGCEACAAVLDELKQVVSRARALEPRPSEADLWAGIAARIEMEERAASSASILPMRTRAGWRVTLTLPQLAAASVLIAAISGGLVWSLRSRAVSAPVDRSAEASRSSAPAQTASVPDHPAERDVLAERPDVLPVSLADAQYDAAVSDLERALKEGRGRLDPATVTIVEHNLQTIDEAIRQAREALAADPANSYLSGHLIEARRRKLDLLRRAAALTTTESD